MDKVLNTILETVEVRKMLTKLTDMAIPYGQDGLEIFAQERGFEEKHLIDSDLFFITNETVFTLLYSSIISLPDRDKYGIFNDEGFMHLNRLILPVKDQQNRVMTWVSWKKGRSQKYLTSKTLGFKKVSAFYGMEYFKDILEKGYAIVVEGMFDVIRWRSLGYNNVLGTMGNDLSFHKRLILNRIPKVIFFPDNDKGGRENSHKNSQSGFSDYRLWMTDGDFVRVELKGKFKDCDDYFKLEQNREMADILIETALTLKKGDVLEVMTS